MEARRAGPDPARERLEAPRVSPTTPRERVPRELREATRRLFAHNLLSKDEALQLNDILDMPPEAFEDEDDEI